MPFYFDNSYARLPARFYARVRPTPVAEPQWLAWNAALADQLGIDAAALASAEGLALFSGNQLPDGIDPIATAYAGHQFGHPVPQLGDGRAILLGDVVGRDGLSYEIQLKGAGPTPFSRRGDGRAAIGPVLREYLVSEAMAALGVPTTRALCAIATGEPVYRQDILPGAVLTRVARSHLRVGTFEFFAMRGDTEALSLLTDFALARLYPKAVGATATARELLAATIVAQADLVAQWMALGFVHGVMNTDNMAISGETIDYGPCAFLDTYAPDRCFSSIDTKGRYAYNQQAACALWNLTRLAEALLPVMVAQGSDQDAAVAELRALLQGFHPRYQAAYLQRFRAKLGLLQAEAADATLIADLLAAMATSRVDFTLAFRRLTEVVEGMAADHFKSLFAAGEVDAWFAAWQQRLRQEQAASTDVTQVMRRANPVIIPRNHLIEQVIAAAIQDDLEPFRRLHAALQSPYDLRVPDYAKPPGEEQWSYRTFCGT